MAKAIPEGENISGYFRRVFKEHPRLLRIPSNQLLYERYLKDHPHESEVPNRVKQILSNVKSILRSQQRKRQAQAIPEPAPADEVSELVSPPIEDTTNRGLEQLEEQIDECLSLAKNLDREGLENVIQHLRRARNEVVMRQG